MESPKSSGVAIPPMTLYVSFFVAELCDWLDKQVVKAHPETRGVHWKFRQIATLNALNEMGVAQCLGSAATMRWILGDNFCPDTRWSVDAALKFRKFIMPTELGCDPHLFRSVVPAEVERIIADENAMGLVIVSMLSLNEACMSSRIVPIDWDGGGNLYFRSEGKIVSLRGGQCFEDFAERMAFRAANEGIELSGTYKKQRRKANKQRTH